MQISTIETELISILICSRGRRTELEKLVAFLREISTLHPFEIIVVEETDSPLSIEGIVYIHHPVRNLGIPYARNLALKKAKGSIIVFIDDDCTPSPYWLDRLLEPLRESSVVGIQGGITVPDATNSIGWAESILGFPGGGIKRILESNGKSLETKEISTLNCAYRKWVIDKSRGFDDRLKLGGEDYVLAKNVCDYGKCLFVPDAMVSHEARGSFFKIWKWFVRRGRAEVNVLRTAEQKNITKWTILKTSISIKIGIFLIIGIILHSCFIPFIAIAVTLFFVIQYLRYYKAWKYSQSSLYSLLLVPMVKFWMDAAMDWGRLRGILFD